MSIESFEQSDIDFLLSPQAIRSRCYQIFELTLAGDGQFDLHMERLDEVADYVLAVIKENYPDLKVPLHSRWGHFQVGGVDRLAVLNKKLARLSMEDRARAKLDLVLVSVLLDAGAGDSWRYTEASSGQTFSRSEGLAVASFQMFMAGMFSSDPLNPCQVDGRALTEFSIDQIVEGFQVSDDNSLVGIEGRLDLLRSLGDAVQQNFRFFINQRPGNLFDSLIATHGSHISAEHILSSVLNGLGTIWPGRISLGQTSLGDVWRYPSLGGEDSLESLVPFHKLSQWLTYSMIEPITEAGIVVSGVEKLTGLAEYRNGGLMLDRGLIELRDQANSAIKHRPDSELIVQWRALTIVLLDKIGDKVRAKLELSESQFPLAKVLEGGTWRAGRKAASEKRADRSPPLTLASDGTVF